MKREGSSGEKMPPKRLVTLIELAYIVKDKDNSKIDIKSAKTQKNKTKSLVFVLRGKNRRQIYHLLLNENLTQTEISILTGISPTNVSRVIKQFKKMKIVRNYTPKERIGAIYGLTSFGNSFKTEFLKHLAFHVIKKTRYSNL